MHLTSVYDYVYCSLSRVSLLIAFNIAILISRCYVVAKCTAYCTDRKVITTKRPSGIRQTIKLKLN